MLNVSRRSSVGFGADWCAHPRGNSRAVSHVPLDGCSLPAPLIGQVSGSYRVPCKRRLTSAWNRARIQVESVGEHGRHLNMSVCPSRTERTTRTGIPDTSGDEIGVDVCILADGDALSPHVRLQERKVTSA